MNEHKTIINKDGFVVASCVLFIDNVPQDFTLEEGQQAVEYLNKMQQVNGRNVELLKPKWTGTEWIETATQEELNVAYPIIKVEPTPEEILRAKLIKDNADMQLQLTQQQKFNADLLLKIANLGGSTNV